MFNLKRNIMDKNIKFLIIALIAMVFTSCLTSGLEELPAFEDAEIVNVFIEHRYEESGDEWVDGANIVKFQRLDLSSTIITSEESGAQNDSIVIVPSVPKPSGSFDTEERQNVSLDNMVVYVNISTAAKIMPLDGAPVLGTPGDFTQPRKYRVTAADGKNFRDWIVVIKPLPAINKYEGLYAESGTLVRIGNPADSLDADIYLQTIDENTCKAQAGKSVFNNSGITYFIKVNGDNSVTIINDPDAVVAIFPQAGKPSTYDPVTKTFDLHYHYRDGARLFDTKLILK